MALEGHLTNFSIPSFTCCKGFLTNLIQNPESTLLDFFYFFWLYVGNGTNPFSKLYIPPLSFFLSLSIRMPAQAISHSVVQVSI